MAGLPRSPARLAGRGRGALDLCIAHCLLTISFLLINYADGPLAARKRPKYAGRAVPHSQRKARPQSLCRKDLRVVLRKGLAAGAPARALSGRQISGLRTARELVPVGDVLIDVVF